MSLKSVPVQRYYHCPGDLTPWSRVSRELREDTAENAVNESQGESGHGSNSIDHGHKHLPYCFHDSS